MAPVTADPTPPPSFPSRGRSLRRGLILGIVHAGLLLAAFAPGGHLWPAALLAVAPALAVGRSRPFWVGLGFALGTLPFWGIRHAWVASISELGVIPLVAYLALTSGLAAGLIAWCLPRLPRAAGPGAAALVWAGVELFRNEIMWDGYPWFSVGHPLIDFPALAAAGAAIGAAGVSFLVALFGAGLGGCGVGLRAGGGIALGVAAAGFGVGAVLPEVGSGPVVRVGVVQTNVPQSVRGEWTLEDRARDMRRFVDLTMSAREQGLDLLVWPETMYPGYFLDNDAMRALDRDRAVEPRIVENIELFRSSLMAAQRHAGAPMLVGNSRYTGVRMSRTPAGDVSVDHDRRYNSAMVVADGAVLDATYDKLHLTPFGEVMPMISAWPWLEERLMRLGVGASGMRFDLARGTLARPLPVPRAGGGDPIPIATPICFEATIPGVCRRLVFPVEGPRAVAMVQMTNDGWFGTSDTGREHHALTSRWRAVELATPLVRAANTGTSGAYDARGRALSAAFDSRPSPARSDGLVVFEVPVAGGGSTLFVRGGWMFGWACGVGAAVVLAFAGFRPAGGGMNKGST